MGTNAHVYHFNENCKGVGLICLKALFYQSGGFEVAAKSSNYINTEHDMPNVVSLNSLGRSPCVCHYG